MRLPSCAPKRERRLCMTPAHHPAHYPAQYGSLCNPSTHPSPCYSDFLRLTKTNWWTAAKPCNPQLSPSSYCAIIAIHNSSPCSCAGADGPERSFSQPHCGLPYIPITHPHPVILAHLPLAVLWYNYSSSPCCCAGAGDPDCGLCVRTAGAALW